MATKTAMQELIEWIDEVLDNEDNAEHKIGLNACQNKAIKLLEKEKQMVIDAFQSGYYECENNAQDRQVRKEDYYTKTYTP